MSSWPWFLSLHPSAWRPQRGGKRNKKRRNKKKGKGKKPVLTAPSGSGGKALVEGGSGPSLEPGKAKDNKENSEEASSTVGEGRFEVASSAVSGSDDALGKEFWMAFDGGNFRWLMENSELEGS